MASSGKSWLRSVFSRGSDRGSHREHSLNPVTAARLLRGRAQTLRGPSRVSHRPELRASHIVDLRKMTSSDGTRSRKARRAQDREAKMRQKRRAREAKFAHKGFRYTSPLSTKIVSRKALRHSSKESVRAEASRRTSTSTPTRLTTTSSSRTFRGSKESQSVPGTAVSRWFARVFGGASAQAGASKRSEQTPSTHPASAQATSPAHSSTDASGARASERSFSWRRLFRRTARTAGAARTAGTATMAPTTRTARHASAQSANTFSAVESVASNGRMMVARIGAALTACWLIIRAPVLVIGSVGSVVALVVLFGFSNIFRVERVVLSGQTQLQQSELNQVLHDRLVKPRWWQAPSRSVLGWTQASVAQAVEQVHPELASLRLERRLPNVIVVHVEDRVPAAIWRTSNGLFFVDQQGYACCEATLSDWADATVPRVTDRSARAVSVNTSVTKDRHMEALHAVEDGIAQNVPVITVDRYEFPAAQAEELHVITQEGVKILFSLGFPIEDQIQKLRVTMAQEVGDRFASLEYIDLRVSEYAYYR